MKIERTLINDHLRVSKIFWKLCIPNIYNFAVIYLWNLQFLKNLAYFLTVSIVFSVYKQNLWLNNLKARTAINAKISVFVICVKAIICLLLYNLHDSTFKRETYLKVEAWL